MKYIILLSYAVVIVLIVALCSPSSYGAECNAENTECTYGFNESYMFGWTPNHTNDNVRGYRVYESRTSQDYQLGQENAYFDEYLLLDENVCIRTEVEFQGDCTSPPLFKTTIGDWYYVVTAVDFQGHESDVSKEVIMHIDDVHTKPMNIRIK